MHASPHEFAAAPSSHSTVESQRAAQSAADKARALAQDALLAAAAVKAAAVEKQKRRKQSTVDRERARLAAARAVVVPTTVPELDPELVYAEAEDSPAGAAMVPAVPAVEMPGAVATVAVGADADSRRHQTPLEDDRVRALEDKVTALDIQLRQTAASMRQRRQAYRADA